jgi:hypothetical protein
MDEYLLRKKNTGGMSSNKKESIKLAINGILK